MRCSVFSMWCSQRGQDVLSERWIFVFEASFAQIINIMTHINKKLKSDVYSGKLGKATFTSVKKDGLTLLHIEAENGSVEEAELLLNEGWGVNVLNEHGDSPLHVAVNNGHDRIVIILLEHGANVDSLSKRKKTPLLLAVENGQSLLVKEILKYGPRQNYFYNQRALDFAVRKSESIYNNIVRDLLEYGFAFTFSDIFDFEPLFKSIEREDTRTVEHLLNFECDIEDSVTDDKTLLHCATEKKNKEIIKLLIKHGHDINAMDRAGRTPLCYAVLQRDLEIVKLLLINNARVTVCYQGSETPLHYTSSYYYFKNCFIDNNDDIIEMAKLLLEQGADINSKRNDGMTTLHLSVRSGLNYLAEFLLKHKADVNAKDSYDRTSLHFAVESRNEVGTELLLKNNALIDEKDKGGETALTRAIRHRNEALFKLLLKYNPDINSTDSVGDTPLMCAARTGNEMIRTLLSSGAHINAKNKKGYTALHIVTEHIKENEDEKLKTLKLLFEYEAKPNSRCKVGMTPLHIAVEGGYTETAEVLLENGADINVTDNKGKTPLDYSTEFNSVEVNHMLKEHLMKLKIADLFLSEQNLQFLGSVSKINESKFEKEINRMKRKISNTDVSFYDILTNQKNILVGLDDEEESVFQVIKSDDYKTEYPSYAYLLLRPITKIRKSIKRIELLRAIHIFFGSFSNHFMKLPHECKEEIFTYLSNKDLKCFEDFKLTN